MAAEIPGWTDLRLQAEMLSSLLWSGRPARVGQTAVVSTMVHTFEPAMPNVVGVIEGSDAGRVFYHRQDACEVVHIDVFHQVGEVDHHRIASWVLRVLEAVGQREHADQMDLQTGTGGGRVSGSLKYGSKPSLRRAHMNHVHITAALRAEEASLIPWLVAGAECGITECGLEIRKVSGIAVQRGDKDQMADLSPYCTPTDSLLKGDQGQRYAMQQQMMQKAMDLAEEFGGIDQVEEILGDLAASEAAETQLSMWKDRPPGWQDQIERLIRLGYVSREGRRLSLSDSGWEIHEFLHMKSREVEMQFRRILRRCPRIRPPKDSESHSAAMGSRSGRAFGVRSVPLMAGDWPNNLAITETVVAAFARAPEEFSVEISDIHTYPERLRHQSDVCLLIDASASMAGKRIRAAKYLAQHLLLTSKDKVSVVVFQEGGVQILVPFTRNFGQVQAGLARVQPMGLTPLAEGLVSALAFIRESRVKKPLLLLITDGIPTVPKWSLNPLEDSLQAAVHIPEARVRFGCIGLQPNRSFLQNLSKCAKGTLYIVDELEKDTLANIAHRERVR